MDNLNNAIEFLEQVDKNGNYHDIISEIENKDLTVTEAKAEIIEILQRWYNETVEGNNIKLSNRISKIALSLQSDILKG